MDRNTRRFSEHVYRLTSITTNKEAGWFLGIDDERVYRIDRTMLEELEKEKLNPIPVPEKMSVDEVAWQKWHKYVTNVVDTKTRMVIWNHQGRGKAVLDKFYHKLGKKNCEEIKAVASDGARGYLKSTREHTDALIVLDHFHVKMYLNNALDAVRKEELKKARKQDNAELEGILHCNQRFIMMKNKPSKKKETILETLSRINQRVYEAILLKDQFLEVYAAPNKKTASSILRKWIVSAAKSGMKPFIDLAEKFFRKRHYILNIFDHRISTAVSEGINNKIKRLRRMAYGYKDVHYFLLKIHQHCGLLNPKLST
jgi:transposase